MSILKRGTQNVFLSADDLCTDQTFINAIHLLADSFLTSAEDKLKSNKKFTNTTTYNDKIVAVASPDNTKNSPQKSRMSRDRRRGKKTVTNFI